MRKFTLLLFSMMVLIGALQSQDFDANNFSILFLTKDITPEGDLEEQGLIDDLRSRGMTVDVTYNVADKAAVSDVEFSYATANTYDLVIVGRGVSSGDFTDIDDWASVTSPIVFFSGYLMRSSRLNLINSTSATREVSDATTIAMDRVAQVAISGDSPLLTGLDADGDGLIGYHTWFHDYIAAAGATFGADNNGMLLGTWSTGDSPSNGNVAVAMWPTGTETYPGSGTTVAGPRLYLSMGSDDSSSPKIKNFTAFTDESALLLHNAIKMFGGATPDGQLIPVVRPFTASDYKVMFITRDVKEDGALEEQGLIDDLKSRGFQVDVTYNIADKAAVSDVEFSYETANSYDLIIVGRGVSSGDFKDIDDWAGVTTPIVYFSAYLMRSSRLNLVNSTSATREVADATTIAMDRVADISITDHPVFTGVDTDGDGLIGYHTWFHDYLAAPAASFATDNNGMMLGAWSTGDSPSNGNVALAMWQTGTETYPSSGTTVAAPRVYFAMGSDDNSSPKIKNFTAFTEESTLVLHNALKMLLGAAPDGVLIPVQSSSNSLGKIAFITRDLNDAGDNLEELSTISELRKRGYTVDVTYNIADKANVADFEFSYETLNNEYDAVIVGRGVSSGDFQDIEGWASVTTPIIYFSSYLMRSSRLNLINSTSATREVADGSTMAMDRIAQVSITDHPIFTGADGNGDGLVDYLTWFTDYIAAPAATFGMDNNGTLLGTWATGDLPSNGNAAIALWPAGTETFPGSGTTVAGHRFYMQMGSDDSSSPKLRNFSAFTNESLIILFNALEFLTGGTPTGILPAAGPVAQLSFEEGEGTVTQERVSGASAEIRNGNGITWESCGVGTSINLAGSTKEDAIIWLEDSPNINFTDGSFSISVLAKIDPYSNTGEMTLLLKGDNKADGTHLPNGNGKWYTIATKDGELRWAIDDNVTKTQLGVAIDETNFPANQWNHIMAVRDRTNDMLMLYINGSLAGMIADDTEESIETTGLPLVIGGYHSGVRKVNGNLDEIAMFDFAFSGQEVADLFASVSIDADCEVVSTIEELSDNANLASIESSLGTLSPDFDPDITSYKLEVPAGTASVTITATAADPTATVEGAGETTNIPGTNVITVTAEDGTVKEYALGIAVEGAGNSKTVVEPGFENLFIAINNALDGDTLVLQNGQEYTPLETYSINKKLVIIAETIPTLPALANMPVINNLFGVQKVFTLQFGADLHLIGIDVDGQGAINIFDTDNTTGASMSVRVNRCRIHNTIDDLFDDAPDGGITMTNLSNCIFRNSFLYDSGSGHGIYVKNFFGEGNFVFENNTFWNLGEQFNWIRHFPSGITQNYTYNHNTGYNLSTDTGDNKELFGNSDNPAAESTLDIDFTNNILHTQISTDPGSLKFNNTSEAHDIDIVNNVLFMVQPIVDGGGTIDKEGNLLDVDPQFADPANGDFTVGNADLHTAATDGEIIGALYWLPGYQDDLADLSTSIDEQFALDIALQLTPNPFVENVQVQFVLEEKATVQLEIYSVSGQLVTAETAENLPAGFHTKNITAADLQAGVYFFKLSTNLGIATTKMIKID